MPETFNDRAPTPSGSPKPRKLGGAQGATNAEPSTKGVAAGGTDNLRITTEVCHADDPRAETSPLRATRAPVSRFNDAAV